MAKKADEKIIDQIIDEMIDTVENSKDDIFSIGEESRKEYEKLKEELKQIKEEVVHLIEEGDRLEVKVRISRNRLSEVSKDFKRYSEEQIRDVYHQTHELQTKLTMIREKEHNLREKRDDTERRLQALEQTVKRAEGLVGKISVVLNYLNEDFKQVSELIHNAQEKQEFGLQIIEAQEEERRRLSREIHDGPAQMLANILLRSEIVDRTFKERGVEEGLKEMKSVRGMVKSSLYEVRRIIYDLRPMALDDLGLVPTIKKYLTTMEEYNHIKISFSSIGLEQRLKSKYEVAFFRLVQESVQNAVKHAEPASINVRLEVKPDNVMILIKDDGKGFDVSEKKDKSFGLLGMRERVEMLDGKLVIRSAIGEGTSIFIQVPINEI
ncbi:histidine kinase [Aquibacillus koreensis]|uniref:Signal transduction histidine-protein kinase/phosphatase DegS n=1 Tax=Aquibacillus koreensis TaxID=279446 RepID=A0A9X3WKR7_9BACI|nr:sensor histidine kinase [Aquibacillus koreensis]MCT2537244.1 histidine kinase [Aquibacillus koreensis]MDC3421592.1 histidine kinase [Aquibacillus koreensis]